MGRLITLIALGFGVFWLFRQLGNKLKKQPKSLEVTQKKMLKCSYCGVHVPQDQCLPYQQKNFCSQEHLNLYNNEQKVEKFDKTDNEENNANPHE